MTTRGILDIPGQAHEQEAYYSAEVIKRVEVIEHLIRLKSLARGQEFPMKPLDGAIEVAIEEAIEAALRWRTAVADKYRAMRQDDPSPPSEK